MTSRSNFSKLPKRIPNKTRNRSRIPNKTRNRSGKISPKILNHITGYEIRTKNKIANEINENLPGFTEAIIDSCNSQMKEILTRMTSEEEVQKIRNGKIYKFAIRRCIKQLKKNSPIIQYFENTEIEHVKVIRVMNLFEEMEKLDNNEKLKYISKRKTVKPRWKGGSSVNGTDDMSLLTIYKAIKHDFIVNTNLIISIIQKGFTYVYELSRHIINDTQPARIISLFGPNGTPIMNGLNDDPEKENYEYATNDPVDNGPPIDPLHSNGYRPYRQETTRSQT